MYHSIVERRVRATFRQISAGNWQPMLTGMAAQFSYTFYGTSALAGERHTIEALRKWWERSSRLLGRPDFEVEEVIVAGGPWATRIATRVRVRALLPDGSAYENIFMQNMRMRWARITEIRSLEDTAVLQQALDRLAQNGIAEAHAEPISDAKVPAVRSGNPGSIPSEPVRYLFRRPLPYVDPHGRRGAFRQALVAAGSGSLTRQLSTTRIWRMTVWRAEPHLQRLSGGRLTTAAGLPVALLETRGARTGQWRRNGVIYFHDDARVTIIASQAGYPGNPGWYYNLLADPDVLLGGEPFCAHVVKDEAELRRLWGLAEQVFPAFAEYRRSAARYGREIPVIQLTRN